MDAYGIFEKAIHMMHDNVKSITEYKDMFYKHKDG